MLPTPGPGHPLLLPSQASSDSLYLLGKSSAPLAWAQQETGLTLPAPSSLGVLPLFCDMDPLEQSGEAYGQNHDFKHVK